MKILKTRVVKTPTRGTSKSAGLDFYVPEDFPETLLLWGESVNIPSGIKVSVPEGYALVANNKSGVALKKGLQFGAAVIDEDYQGEMHLHVTNINRKGCTIYPGEKILQFLLLPVLYANVEEVNSEEELFGGEKTERGAGGFGSTGTV